MSRLVKDEEVENIVGVYIDAAIREYRYLLRSASGEEGCEKKWRSAFPCMDGTWCRMRVTGELVIRSFRCLGLIGGVMGTWIYKFLVKQDEADQ